MERPRPERSCHPTTSLWESASAQQAPPGGRGICRWGQLAPQDLWEFPLILPGSHAGWFSQHRGKSEAVKFPGQTNLTQSRCCRDTYPRKRGSPSKSPRHTALVLWSPREHRGGLMGFSILTWSCQLYHWQTGILFLSPVLIGVSGSASPVSPDFILFFPRPGAVPGAAEQGPGDQVEPPAGA